MLFFLLSLYPLYKTVECIRGWNKVKKEHFQHWLIFWSLYLLCDYIYTIISYVWLLNYLLSLYKSICVVFLLCCYFPHGTMQSRKYILLPALREFKRFLSYIYPYVYPLIQIGSEDSRTLIISIFYKFL